MKAKCRICGRSYFNLYNALDCCKDEMERRDAETIADRERERREEAERRIQKNIQEFKEIGADKFLDKAIRGAK